MRAPPDGFGVLASEWKMELDIWGPFPCTTIFVSLTHSVWLAGKRDSRLLQPFCSRLHCLTLVVHTLLCTTAWYLQGKVRYGIAGQDTSVPLSHRGCGRLQSTIITLPYFTIPVGLYPVCVLLQTNNNIKERRTNLQKQHHPSISILSPSLSLSPPSVLCNGCTYTYIQLLTSVIRYYSITCFQLPESDSIVSIIFPFPALQRQKKGRGEYKLIYT